MILHYLSMSGHLHPTSALPLEQEARSSGKVSPLFALEVRETIEAIERAFGAEVQVRAFERGQLSDGDVTRDFLEHALRVSPNMLETVAAVVSNKGDSAEVMDISVRNRRLNHPGSDFTFVREHMRLLERLRSIERQGHEELASAGTQARDFRSDRPRTPWTCSGCAIDMAFSSRILTFQQSTAPR